MKRHRNRNSVVVLEQTLVKSKAWLALGGMSPQVYLVFRCRCQVGRRSGCRQWSVLNNGELVFTYAEARSKWGITAPRFRRAIDDLIDKGFLDVASTGMGVHRVVTFYALSDRWQSYGEPTFRPAARPKPVISNMGFRRGNKLTPKKKPSDENVHGAVNEIVHGSPLAVNKIVHGKNEENCDKALCGAELDRKPG